jgi:hypothetical protein
VKRAILIELIDGKTATETVAALLSRVFLNLNATTCAPHNAQLCAAFCKCLIFQRVPTISVENTVESTVKMVSFSDTDRVVLRHGGMHYP